MSKAKSKKKIVVNGEEAAIVKEIYSLYLSGLEAKSIAQRLNVEGKLCRGRFWANSRILSILQDECYLGQYFYDRRDKKSNRLKPREQWVAIAVERIIDEETWLQTQRLREERNPGTPNGNPAIVGSKTLLTGLAVCGLCRGKMTMESAKGGRFVYYNCGNFIRRGKSVCPGQRIPIETLEKAILDHMANRLFTVERVEAILRGVYQEIRNMTKSTDGQRNSLVRQLEVVKTGLERQYQAIESGGIDFALLGERIKELKSPTPKTVPLSFFQESAIASFQQTVRELFLNSESREMTKRYLKLFIDRITINLPRVEIVGKTAAILATLENKTAVRTDGVLTAGGSWLPGTDSNCRPSGYKCPGISTRLGLSHHPSQIQGLRVSGASPPSLRRRVRAEALVSAPSLSYRRFKAWLRITILHINWRAGFPEFTRFFNHDFSWKLHVLQPPALPTELPGNKNDLNL
jgi:site-specific DNA recombinase